jgi:3-oxoacyl-[acyl-carrier-protein] synthase-1
VTVVMIGSGARTAIGMTAPSTAAAVRAGISGFVEHPFVVDTAGKRMIVAAAPYVGIEVTGAARLAQLAAPAAAEAVASLSAFPIGQLPVSLFVGLPPVRPGRGNDVPATVAARLREELPSICRVATIGVIETGHAAGTTAIQRAWQAVRSGVSDFALAGGVDSYLEPDTLEWLEENDQVHSAGPENNAYGFIPGEGAGFVLLATAAAAQRYQLSAALELMSVAGTRETKLIKSGAVCTGEGLTELFRALAGEPPTIKADHLYCDMNGEPYRADEFGFATTRAAGLFREPGAFTTPADCWGDVGAASGPLLLLLAEAATRKGYAAGPVLAAFTSSESGERCGFLVRERTDAGAR